MDIVRQNKKIIINLSEDEDEVISYLERRGSTYLKEAFTHWLKSRMDTVEDELKTQLMGTVYSGKTIKELKIELKRVKGE